MASAPLHASSVAGPAALAARDPATRARDAAGPAPLLAALLTAALASRALALPAGHLDELWYLCHVATAFMIVGLAAGARRVVAGAWLYHLVWGAPVWLAVALATGVLHPTSIAAHLGPLVLGGWWLARRPWPGPIALPAWMVGVAALIVARPLTDPAHNVNAAYQVWPPLAGVFPSVAWLWIVTSLACLALMLAGDTLLVRRARRRR